jgi:hypothetical protein
MESIEFFHCSLIPSYAISFVLLLLRVSGFDVLGKRSWLRLFIYLIHFSLVLFESYFKKIPS